MLKKGTHKYMFAPGPLGQVTALMIYQNFRKLFNFEISIQKYRLPFKKNKNLKNNKNKK